MSDGGGQPAGTTTGKTTDGTEKPLKEPDAVQAPVAYVTADIGFFKISTSQDHNSFCFDDSAVATKNFSKIRGISNIQMNYGDAWDSKILRGIQVFYGREMVSGGVHGFIGPENGLIMTADFVKDHGGLADGEYFNGMTVMYQDQVNRVCFYTNLGTIWDPTNMLGLDNATKLQGLGTAKVKPYTHFISATGAELVYISGQTDGSRNVNGRDYEDGVISLTFNFYGEKNPSSLVEEPLTIHTAT